MNFVKPMRRAVQTMAIVLALAIPMVSVIAPADARIDYGMKDEHCWSGDHEHVNAISRLTYNNRFIPLMADHWTKTAPKGADVKSWRY